jgi:hypothetical protein
MVFPPPCGGCRRGFAKHGFAPPERASCAKLALRCPEGAERGKAVQVEPALMQPPIRQDDCMNVDGGMQSGRRVPEPPQIPGLPPTPICPLPKRECVEAGSCACLGRPWGPSLRGARASRPRRKRNRGWDTLDSKGGGHGRPCPDGKPELGSMFPTVPCQGAPKKSCSTPRVSRRGARRAPASGQREVPGARPVRPYRGRARLWLEQALRRLAQMGSDGRAAVPNGVRVAPHFKPPCMMTKNTRLPCPLLIHCAKMKKDKLSCILVSTLNLIIWRKQT